MFELLLYVYSCNALSARFSAVYRTLNSYFMIMITIIWRVEGTTISVYWCTSWKYYIQPHQHLSVTILTKPVLQFSVQKDHLTCKTVPPIGQGTLQEETEKRAEWSVGNWLIQVHLDNRSLRQTGKWKSHGSGVICMDVSEDKIKEKNLLYQVAHPLSTFSPHGTYSL